MDLTQAGDLVLLTEGDAKRFLVRLKPDGSLQTHRGVLRHQDLIGLPWGSQAVTHLGSRYRVLPPSLHDLLLYLKRRSQIIFPKDIGYILLRLSAGPGKRILEAGTGSGALTLALAWAVGDQGRVYSVDRREDMQELARENLERVGLAHRVEFQLGDIGSTSLPDGMDAAFLDVHDPHFYLANVRTALRPGGFFGAIVPTANQISLLAAALPASGFGFVEVCEILLRFYKTVPERVRPVDRMVAHTGYLVFARPHRDESGSLESRETDTGIDEKVSPEDLGPVEMDRED